MSILVEVVRQSLSVLTMLTHIFFAIFLIYLIFRYISKTKIAFVEAIIHLIKKKFLLFSFIVALTATSGSLFFSEIALYEPCKLCWFQRIFMYPLVLLFLIALISNDKKITRYALPLSIIGVSISSYHYISSTFSKVASSGVCSATGPSCLFEYFTEFGYVTIPLMAFSAFFLIISFNLIGKRN